MPYVGRRDSSMLDIMALRTCSAPRRAGRCSSITNRVECSTEVPIAEPLSLPVIRSTPRLPGTARSSASDGRSLIMTWSGSLRA